MQRAGVESILGVRLEGARLGVAPCIPRWWPGFEVKIRYRSAWYEIVVENPERLSSGIGLAECDGVAIETRPLTVAMVDDGRVHQLKVQLGKAPDRRIGQDLDSMVDVG